MDTNHSPSLPRKPLRLWPGVVAVTLQWLVMFGLPLVMPDQGGTGVLGGFAGGVLVLVWWLFFSRAAWLERLGAIAAMVAAVAATKLIVHPSIANGMMGMMIVIYAIPLLSLALVASMAASRGLANGRRRAMMAAAILLACGALTLVRTNGISGDANSDFQWRWTPTAEERLLALAGHETVKPPPTAPAPVPTTAAPTTASSPAPAVAKMPEKADVTPPVVAAAPASAPAAAPAAPVETDADAGVGAGWPGFRGPERDSAVHGGARIATDWVRTPPVELWRRPIGPGWSSFAVRGDRIYTQEQRGDDEIVSAYALKTGEPVWRHRDPARFWESNAGAGPRATPTLSGGRVYTLGATGILNALDARDGSVIWSRNAATDTGRKVPAWGIASSPLVAGNVVIAATAGTLAAYDIATGKLRWIGSKEGWGYSSPQLSTIDGVPQVVLVNGPGVIGVAPSDGKVLWTYPWPGDSIVQPARLGDADLLIGSGSGMADKNGMLRVTVTHDAARSASSAGSADGASGAGSAASAGGASGASEASGWSVKERWTSAGLKPYFNDFVVHKGHAFGFDGSILACIDLENGNRAWKGGRYGHGQLVLLPDQDLLLVLSEEGELALVSATADKFTEIARFPALADKTWNHPVLVGDMLLVRNGQEMAAFRLSLAGR
jgi:outer membrane protein assembly factor BamB